jgi:hypothetical protein
MYIIGNVFGGLVRKMGTFFSFTISFIIIIMKFGHLGGIREFCDWRFYFFRLMGYLVQQESSPGIEGKYSLVYWTLSA